MKPVVDFVLLPKQSESKMLRTPSHVTSTDTGLSIGFKIKDVAFPEARTEFDLMRFASIDRLPFSELLKIYPPKARKPSETVGLSGIH